MRIAVRMAGLWLALVSIAGVAGAQGPGARASAAGIPMHYENADLTRIVDDVSRATGLRFLYGDEFRGRVTITVPDRVTPDVALELLFAAMYMRGFTALPMEGDTIRIAPVLETSSSAPVADEPDRASGERPITTLVKLERLDAQQAVESLAPYLPRSAVALAHGPTNSLVLAGTEGQLVRLVTIARTLDQAADENLMVRSLRYRSADLAAEMVDTIFNDTSVPGRQVEIWTDARANQIVARGHRAQLAAIRAFLEDFDVPVEGEGLVRVVRILNRDAEEIAGILTGLATAGQPRAGSGRALGVEDALTGRDYHIEVDVPTQSLLIRADAETFEILARTIGEIDRLPPRVSVEVLVFEVTRPRGFKLGVNYFLPLSNPSSPSDFIVFTNSVGGAASGPTGDSVAFGRYVRAPVLITLNDPVLGTVTVPIPREDVSFEAGELLAETNILLRPNIVGVSGQEHEVFVGNNIPVPTARAASVDADGNALSGNPLNVEQNIERVDVGTRLRIEPTLGEEGVVRLAVDLEVSQLTNSRAGPVEEVGPTYATRDIEATVEIRPGERAVIGAAGAAVTTERRVGVPFLMDIPFLGWFFGTLEQRSDQTDLVAVIEARVLRDADDATAETIRRRIAFERAISRSVDLNSLGPEPFAVLLDTTRSEADAKVIARAFAADGFSTRITPWKAQGQERFDVYLSDLSSFEEAGRLARRLSEAGWSPEIAVLSPVNELAGD